MEITTLTGGGIPITSPSGVRVSPGPMTWCLSVPSPERPSALAPETSSAPALTGIPSLTPMTTKLRARPTITSQTAGSLRLTQAKDPSNT
jgi:hypothetical protein